MKSILGIVGLLLFLTELGYAQDSLCTVSGTIQYKKEGKLFLSLSTESQFMKKDVAPADFIILEDTGDSLGNKIVPFLLDSIPRGQYVISVFQDVNGNGELDMGFMGPKEPFGFSGPRPKFIPKYKNLNFDVNGDMADINIEVK